MDRMLRGPAVRGKPWRDRAWHGLTTSKGAFRFTSTSKCLLLQRCLRTRSLAERGMHRWGYERGASRACSHRTHPAL